MPHWVSKVDENSMPPSAASGSSDTRANVEIRICFFIMTSLVCVSAVKGGKAVP